MTMPAPLTLPALAVIATLGAPATASADAPEWTVDAAKSSISFTGRQMGAPSKGRFKSFTASIHFDPQNLAASRIEVTIDPASADTGNPDIDKELKQPKWFDVASFPSARFVASAFRSKGGGDYEAVATLTMRDVTEEVVLPFKLDIAADGSARARGSLAISRTKFGIGRDEWRDTKIVADEVTIHIDVVARRKP